MITGMYTAHFGLKELPFTITPDPRYLFMSERHREALAHLLYGAAEGGGFVQLTGEVGTGKTTLCRCLLEQLPPKLDVALILNPKLTSLELLAAVCDELRIAYPEGTTSAKVLVDALYAYLLDAHARGRRTMLIVDEAQDLSADVLEQIRLLTNLETAREKLLQIILIGQPELIALLDREDLRQLAQRITARYHLQPFTEEETRAYIRHRLQIAGRTRGIFTDRAIRRVHRASGGIPRLINIICDRSLLGAYSQDRTHIDARTVTRAATEVRGRRTRRFGPTWRFATVAAALVAIAGVAVAVLAARPFGHGVDTTGPTAPGLSSPAASSSAPTSAANANGTSVTGAASPAATPVAAAATGSTVAGPPSPAVAPPTAASAAPSAASTPAALSSTASLPATARAAGTASATLPTTATAVAAFVEPARTPRLAQMLADATLPADEVSAFTALYTRWGIAEARTKARKGCTAAREEGLRCLLRTGSWKWLRRYNVPAIVELAGPSGIRHFAAVVAIDSSAATLDVGGREITVPLKDVERFWNGDFIVVWRPPALGAVPLAPGARARDVDWLRRRLASIDGGAATARVPELYDRELRERVVSFQKSRALDGDGIVGEETLIHLMLALPEPGVPVLSGS